MNLRKFLITLILGLLVSQAFAQSPARFNLTMEVMELNLAREIVVTNRLQLNVAAESEQADFLQIMTKRLNELGWTLNWQDERNILDNSTISDFYRFGGQHLRLELSETSLNNYRMLIYRF